MRIYALAKELDIDSKDLVEVCRKAGISGKGSALASLTDDEIVKLKAFLRGGDKKADAGAAAAGAAARRTTPEVYRREDYIAPVPPGKVKVLDVTGRRPTPKGEVGRPAEEEQPGEIEQPQESVAQPAVEPPVLPGLEPAAAPLVQPPEERPQESPSAAPIAAQVQVDEQALATAESKTEPPKEERWAER